MDIEACWREIESIMDNVNAIFGVLRSNMCLLFHLFPHIDID